MKCASLVFSIVANWLKQAKTTKMKIYELMKCFISVFTRLNLVLLKVKEEEYCNMTIFLWRAIAFLENQHWKIIPLEISENNFYGYMKKKQALKKSTCQTYKNPFWFWHWISTGLFDQVTLFFYNIYLGQAMQVILGSGCAGCAWVRLCKLCLG